MHFVLFCATGGGSTEWNVQTESRPTLCEIPEKCNFGITIGSCDLYWCWKYKRCVCLLAMDGFSIFSLSICCSLLLRLSGCFYVMKIVLNIFNPLQSIAISCTICLFAKTAPMGGLDFFVLNIFNLFQSVAICCTVRLSVCKWISKIRVPWAALTFQGFRCWERRRSSPKRTNPLEF